MPSKSKSDICLAMCWITRIRGKSQQHKRFLMSIQMLKSYIAPIKPCHIWCFVDYFLNLTTILVNLNMCVKIWLKLCKSGVFSRFCYIFSIWKKEKILNIPLGHVCTCLSTSASFYISCWIFCQQILRASLSCYLLSPIHTLWQQLELLWDWQFYSWKFNFKINYRSQFLNLSVSPSLMKLHLCPLVLFSKLIQLHTIT